jgi:hypothetical protein
MTVVFVSGSRKIGRLNEDVRSRIENMVRNRLQIVTGDANGADRAMQAHLADLQYKDVTIYFVGDAPRNNVGNWPTNHVIGSDKLSGREFYAQKDREMSKIADYGFVLWDGKSSGSVQNMLWLLREGKKVVLYLVPKKEFFSFVTEADLVDLLARFSDEILDDIGRKISLPIDLKRANRRQPSLDFRS